MYVLIDRERDKEHIYTELLKEYNGQKIACPAWTFRAHDIIFLYKLLKEYNGQQITFPCLDFMPEILFVPTSESWEWKVVSD